MAEPENFVSQLPQPTRHTYASPHKHLSELSASANNARTGIAMPPPPFKSHKRPGSNLPDVAQKRRTLADRAGEPLKSSAAVPRYAASSHAVTPNPHARPPSALSQSHRSNPHFSRSTTGPHAPQSLAMSVGSGIRPPGLHPASSGLARPKTSLAKDRAARSADARPATALGTRAGTQDGPENKRMDSLPKPYPRLSPFPAVRNAPTFAPKRDVRSLSSSKSCEAPGHSSPEERRIALTSSMMSQFSGLSLGPVTPKERRSSPVTSPSRIPRTAQRVATPQPKDPFTPLPFPRPSSPCKSKCATFLTKDSTIEAWDPEEQYGNMERMYEEVCTHYKQAMADNVEAKETTNTYKSAIAALEQEKKETMDMIIALKCDLQTTQFRLEVAERTAHEVKRSQEEEFEDLKRQHRIELETVRHGHRRDVEGLKADHREEARELKRKLEDELENEKTQRLQAMSQVSTQGALDRQRHQMEMDARDQELRTLSTEIDRLQADVRRQQTLNDELLHNLSSAGANAVSMETAKQALQAKIEYLESDSKSQSEAYATMEQRMNEAMQKAVECEEKLRKEEQLRRRLHNQVQELKGNIRVFCRVRPTNGGGETEEPAKITFPEADDEELKEIEVKGPDETNSLGKTTTKSHQFQFDRVFDPASDNGEIFEEISQLIQSALDGYNVCIFAYGQTGSGKTFTMSSDDGMIPRALRQIYTTSKELGSRGWSYTMEGSFVEVYNEELRDLLGKDGDHERGTKKHEIRHDMATCETTITDVTTLTLDSQEQVEVILAQAMARRSVAATKANERSSRSHSVFILKLTGHNAITGKSCKGYLNLVDLAGSERLSHSKVEGARLKETQNINKSLSCLGDVIGALGQQQPGGGGPPKDGVPGSSTTGAGHIPYRNSKLTYLLQFSLGGNSKTLMFVMVAPEKKCLAETITSLKFADKVSRTRIGVAKKTGGR